MGRIVVDEGMVTDDMVAISRRICIISCLVSGQQMLKIASAMGEGGMCLRVRSTEHDIQAGFDSSNTLLQILQLGSFLSPSLGSTERDLGIPIGDVQSADNVLEIDQLDPCSV